MAGCIYRRHCQTRHQVRYLLTLLDFNFCKYAGLVAKWGVCWKLWCNKYWHNDYKTWNYFRRGLAGVFHFELWERSWGSQGVPKHMLLLFWWYFKCSIVIFGTMCLKWLIRLNVACYGRCKTHYISVYWGIRIHKDLFALFSLLMQPMFRWQVFI